MKMLMHSTLLTPLRKKIRNGKVRCSDLATSRVTFISNSPDTSDDAVEANVHRWTPVPLRARFWIPLYTFMVLLAIGLEIALHFSNKQHGMAPYT